MKQINALCGQNIRKNEGVIQQRYQFLKLVRFAGRWGNNYGVPIQRYRQWTAELI